MEYFDEFKKHLINIARINPKNLNAAMTSFIKKSIFL